MNIWKLRASGALLCAGSLFAAQKWLDQDYRAWTDAQAQQVLYSSPWARQAGATINVENQDDPRTLPAQAPLAPGQSAPGPSYASDGYGVDDGKWDGGVMKKRRGEPPSLPVTIRWASALPVREALVKTHDTGAADTENTLNKPETHYIITVTGLVPAAKAKAADSSENTNPAFDLTRMRYGFLASTRLVVKGKYSIAPDDVHVDTATGTVTLYFPKSQPITPSDKEVEFRTAYGGLRVSEKFRLKDMMSHGQLEL